MRAHDAITLPDEALHSNVIRNARSRIGGILDDREDEPRIVGPCVVVQSGAREFLARDLRLAFSGLRRREPQSAGERLLS